MFDQDNKVVSQSSASRVRNVLFLQGPITPFFRDIANQLERQGCNCFRINLCFGDWLFWRGRTSTEYRGAQANWPEFIKRYLLDNNITDLILLGEQRYYHKVAIKLAREQSIQVITTDFGYLRPDWITFERNGMSANSEFPNNAQDIMQMADGLAEPDLQQRYSDSFVRQVFWDVQYHLLSTLLRILYLGYRSHQIHHPIFVYLGTGLRLLKLKFFATRKANQFIDQLVDSSQPYMVFPLQMQNDFQIRAYSKYDNLEQAIEEVIESFAANAPAAMNLVIKVHPLDPGMISWRRICSVAAQNHGVGSRVHYIEGGCLDTLLESCQGVVTINSTVGVWSLRQSKPLYVLGEAVFKVAGLVHQGMLDDFWTAPQPPEPALLEAFMRAIAASIHIRGVYYSQPGLANAVDEAVHRLLKNKINQGI